MHDPRDGQVRYLVHFSDDGSGMRWQEQPLEAGFELRDGGGVYEVERVAWKAGANLALTRSPARKMLGAATPGLGEDVLRVRSPLPLPRCDHERGRVREKGI
jgi:hypothetical protein